jgi:hypothetical protein
MRILQVCCRVGTALAACMISWSVVYIFIIESRWAALYQLALLVLIALNLIPASGVYVARALHDGLSRTDRALFFLAWLIPTLAVFAVDLFVLLLNWSSP